MRGEHLLGRARREWRAAGDQLITERPHGVDVHAMIEVRIRGRLLRRHVRRGSERDPGGREPLTTRGLAQRLGNAEVHDERVPAREQHVVRLDVAMRDAVRVGVGERVHDLHEDLHRVVDRQLAVPGEPVAQRLAFHVRHHIVEEPARLA